MLEPGLPVCLQLEISGRKQARLGRRGRAWVRGWLGSLWQYFFSQRHLFSLSSEVRHLHAIIAVSSRHIFVIAVADSFNENPFASSL